MKPRLTFALAVNNERKFTTEHFGEAHYFQIFDFIKGDFNLVKEIDNPYRIEERDGKHGDKSKGKAISNLLRSEGVNIILARRFGSNLSLINEHFIPVLMDKEFPGEALSTLSNYVKWIEEEVVGEVRKHKLFSIHNGILKTEIKD